MEHNLPEHRQPVARAAQAAVAEEDINVRALRIAEKKAGLPSGASAPNRRIPVLNQTAVFLAAHTFRKRESRAATAEELADEMLSGRHLQMVSYFKEKTRGAVEPATGRQRPRLRAPLPKGAPGLAPISEESQLFWQPDEQGDWDDEDRSHLEAAAVQSPGMWARRSQGEAERSPSPGAPPEGSDRRDVGARFASPPLGAASQPWRPTHRPSADRAGRGQADAQRGRG